MDIKEQVCDPKLAAELKRLGVKQDSVYYWDSQGNLRQTRDAVAAFTVAELGEKLPSHINISGKLYWLTTHRYGTETWKTGYESYARYWLFDNEDSSEANTKARSLITCINNGYIKDVDWLEVT